jgi:hypothetical protein
MPTVTSKNREEFNANEMEKKSLKKEKLSAGEHADKAWAMSFKSFPSMEAAKAHREAAKAYRKENMHDLAERHEDTAHSHLKELMKKKD